MAARAGPRRDLLPPPLLRLGLRPDKEQKKAKTELFSKLLAALNHLRAEELIEWGGRGGEDGGRELVPDGPRRARRCSRRACRRARRWRSPAA